MPPLAHRSQASGASKQRRTGLVENLAADGQYFAIFTDGHHRQLPRLTGGPFLYKTDASSSVEKAIKKHGSPDVARDIAFKKIESRVKGAALASEALKI